MHAFSYTISAGGIDSHGEVTVRTLSRTDTISVRDDFFTMDAGTVGEALFVLNNDVIVKGDAGSLKIQSVEEPTAGAVSISDTGGYLLYTAPKGFIGFQEFSYTAIDNAGGSGTAIVKVFVGSGELNPDRFYVPKGAGEVVLDILANDPFKYLESGNQNIHGLLLPVSPTLGGKLEITKDFKKLKFTPGETGEFEYEYKVIFEGPVGFEDFSTDKITIVVNEDQLSASTDKFTVKANSLNNILDVTYNDYQVDDLDIVIQSIDSVPSKGGVVSIRTDGSLSYSPPEGFIGEEYFVYTVTDGKETDTTTAVIEVSNGALRAAQDHFYVFAESDATILDVLANDMLTLDRDDVSISSVFISSGGGSLIIADDSKSIIYKPEEGFRGDAEISYEISDSFDNRATGTALIKVINREGQLELLTNEDKFTVRQDSVSNVLNVLSNDSVKPNSTTGWRILDAYNVVNGNAIILGGDSIMFTPTPGFVGEATFEYVVSDGLGGTGKSTVSVSVGNLRPVKDQFVVLSGSTDNILNVSENDGLLPDEAATIDGKVNSKYLISSVSVNGGGGEAALGNDGEILYTPDKNVLSGTASLTYELKDDSGNVISQVANVMIIDGQSDRDQGVVTVTVTGVNDNPSISGSKEITVSTNGDFSIFPDLVVSDIDDNGNELISVSITPDDFSKGLISDPSGKMTTDGQGTEFLI